MSNDYFKAQGWFKTYALNSQDSRGVFQQLVKEDEEAFRLASAETDRIKAMMNEKYGPGTVKYGSEIKQPEIKTPQAAFEFSQRNPAAEGGRMRFDEGLSAKQKKALTITYGKDATKDLEIKRNPGADKVFNKSTNDMYEQFGKEVVDAASIQEYGVPFNEYRPADDVKGAKRQNFIRYFKKDMEDYGEYIGTKNPDKDRRTMKRGIRAEREAAIKVNLINKIKDGKKFNVENFLKKNNLTLPELKKEAVQLQRNIYTKRMIATGGKSRATLKWLTDDINTTDKVLETLSKSKLIQNKSGSLGNVMFDAFGREFLKGSDVKNPDYNVEKLNAIKKNLNEYNVLNKYLQDTYGINTQLDHPLSQQTIKKLMNGTAEELSRVNILEQDLNNGFKKTLNYRYLKAVNNNNLVQKRAVEKIAKDLNFNIGSVPDGQFIDVSKIDRGVDSFETLDIKKEMFKSLKNAANLDSEFTKYITANPEVLKDAGINVDTLKEPKNVKNIANNIDEIEKYITDRTGKVKPPMFSSGFAGAYEMLSDDLKAIVNSDGYKKFANSKAGKTLSMAAKTPGKLFGIGDVLIGYLDYTNNKPMMSKAKAYENMLQAMSFGIYRGGDKQNLEEIKTKFIENGGDGKIFDQVVDLNKSNFKMKGYIENIKKSYKDLSSAGYEDMAKKQMKSALNNVKTMGEKNLDKFAQYKTDLAVSESGGPIQIKDITQPIKDTKKAAFDLFEEEQIKNYPSTYDQVNTESGPVAEQIYNSILTKDSYKKLLPQNLPSTVNQLLGLNFKPVTEKEKEAALIQEMKKNAPQELYRYNKEFRGMNPDEPMTIEETANFMNKNKKAIGFAEGGITGLRSKYEYKK